MRYFFHVQTQEKMLLDDFGTELADEAAALAEAKAVYRELRQQFTLPKSRIRFRAGLRDRRLRDGTFPGSGGRMIVKAP